MGVAERNVDNFTEPKGVGPEPVRAMRAMGNVAQLENGNLWQGNLGETNPRFGEPAWQKPFRQGRERNAFKAIQWFICSGDAALRERPLGLDANPV